MTLYPRGGVMATTCCDLGDRVIAAGQYLGTHNRIHSLSWLKTRGWKAEDITGESYYQRGGARSFPDGLQTADEPQDCTGLPLTPWPSAPGEEQ